MKLFDTLESLYYNVIYGIQNLYNWFPVIWKDREWDYIYFLSVMRKKLSNMETNMRKYGHHTTSPEHADDMNKCVDILDRIISGDYCEEEHRAFSKKWGELNFDSTPFRYENETDDNDPSEEMRAIMKKQEELAQKDIDDLCKALKKFPEWWY